MTALPASDVEWAEIAGYDGYWISTDGQVTSMKRPVPRVLAPSPTRGGYLAVGLSSPGRPRTRKLHRLVVEAFLGPCPEGLEVRHLNGDVTDNRLANLAYGTHSENIRDSVSHGQHANARKTHCRQGHPFSGANLIITPQGGRKCRLCRAIYNETRRAKRRAGR